METYSSLKLAASLKACSSRLFASLESVAWEACPETFGKPFDLAVDLAQHGLRADADFLEHRRNDTFLVLEQRGQQVDRLQLGIAVLGCEVVRRAEQLPAL